MDIILLSLQDFATGIAQAFSLFGGVWYFLLPPILYPIWKTVWMDHIQDKYAGSLSHVLLEIIPPKEVEKSPKPMESIFAGMLGVAKNYNVIEEYVLGQFPDSYSLEMVGDGSAVHFYIRTLKQNRGLVESHFYAQYPDAQIMEVPDYIDEVPRTVPNDSWDLWGTDLKLTKPDLYPIRTYRFFEEDVTGKMIDPLAGVIEALARAGTRERMWFQMIISPEKASFYDKGKATIDEFLGKKKPESKSALGQVISDIVDVLRNLFAAAMGAPSFATSASESKDEQPLEFRLSPGQKEVLKALEANLGKPMFRVKMRFLYLGEREVFDKAKLAGFFGALGQFNDLNLNGFAPYAKTKTAAQFLLVNQRLRYMQRRIFRRYIARDPDPSEIIFDLSTEELATVFHIPDFSVISPMLVRVDSKRGSAPPNLPIFEE